MMVRIVTRQVDAEAFILLRFTCGFVAGDDEPVRCGCGIGLRFVKEENEHMDFGFKVASAIVDDGQLGAFQLMCG
jgi:hypothetical protein